MIKVAVVGCGYWGPNLVRNFRSIPECEVKQICDMDHERLAKMQELYPEINTTTKFEELVKDDEIDAVAIATPVFTHFELAKKSLMAGKHTFIEKPMAAKVDQCIKLIELAKKKELTLMVGHTFIYSAPVRKVKEIVESGDLGELLCITSQRLNLGLYQRDINVVWDLAPHDVSIVLYVMDEFPVAVNCQGKAHLASGIEDVTNMTLNFKNGGFAIIQSSWLDPNKVRRMTFVGSRKMVLYDDCQPYEKLRIYDKRVEIPRHYDTLAEFHYAYHHGDMHCPALNLIEPLKAQCQHFLDCIREGSDPQTSGFEGLDVVRILEAASKSLKKGGARIEIEDRHPLQPTTFLATRKDKIVNIR